VAEINSAIQSPEFLADFPVTNPTVAQITAAVSDYKDAFAKETSKSVIALRAAKRETLTNLLITLALDLEEKAQGDRLKLSHTGYDVTKPRGTQTGGITLTPKNLRLYVRLTGQILAKVKALGGKTLYIGAYTYDPINGPWITIDPVTDSQNILFTGLDRARDVYIKIMAIGPHGPSDWSDIATILVN
jgi:hypothetical protein